MATPAEKRLMEQHRRPNGQFGERPLARPLPSPFPVSYPAINVFDEMVDKAELAVYAANRDMENVMSRIVACPQDDLEPG